MSQADEAPVKHVGPDYREEKPTATVSTSVEYENVHILPQTPQLIALLTQVPADTDGYTARKLTYL
jgi:uracil phosphoribosyltransferase